MPRVNAVAIVCGPRGARGADGGPETPARNAAAAAGVAGAPNDCVVPGLGGSPGPGVRVPGGTPAGLGAVGGAGAPGTLESTRTISICSPMLSPNQPFHLFPESLFYRPKLAT